MNVSRCSDILEEMAKAGNVHEEITPLDAVTIHKDATHQSKHSEASQMYHPSPHRGEHNAGCSQRNDSTTPYVLQNVDPEVAEAFLVLRRYLLKQEREFRGSLYLQSVKSDKFRIRCGLRRDSGDTVVVWVHRENLSKFVSIANHHPFYSHYLVVMPSLQRCVTDFQTTR